MEQNNLKADILPAGEIETDFSNFQLRSINDRPENWKPEIIVKADFQKTAVWDGSELNLPENLGRVNTYPDKLADSHQYSVNLDKLEDF